MEIILSFPSVKYIAQHYYYSTTPIRERTFHRQEINKGHFYGLILFYGTLSITAVYFWEILTVEGFPVKRILKGCTSVISLFRIVEKAKQYTRVLRVLESRTESGYQDDARRGLLKPSPYNPGQFVSKAVNVKRSSLWSEVPGGRVGFNRRAYNVGDSVDQSLLQCMLTYNPQKRSQNTIVNQETCYLYKAVVFYYILFALVGVFHNGCIPSVSLTYKQTNLKPLPPDVNRPSRELPQRPGALGDQLLILLIPAQYLDLILLHLTSKVQYAGMDGFIGLTRIVNSSLERLSSKDHHYIGIDVNRWPSLHLATQTRPGRLPEYALHCF
ncbi:hypothetical protein J6590_070954 [Homalodisca vitripennis]|nr:hypothetical protein J6590_070954 [Homalodisca vitripennis]